MVSGQPRSVSTYQYGSEAGFEMVGAVVTPQITNSSLLSGQIPIWAFDICKAGASFTSRSGVRASGVPKRYVFGPGTGGRKTMLKPADRFSSFCRLAQKAAWTISVKCPTPGSRVVP